MDTKKYFLVTTADETTWVKDAPILFLGEWCKRYSRTDVWACLESEVVPYHWNDRKKLNKDYQYLNEFYEELLKDLSKKLNEIHRVNHDIRYWRIFIGPWLGYFTQILFDRWYSIKQAINNYEIEGTILFEGLEESLVPNDMTQFINLNIENYAWNHYLYAEIIQRTTNIRVTMIKREVQTKNQDSAPKQSFKGKVKQYLLRSISKTLVFLFQKTNDIFLLNTYMPFADELRLYLKFKQVPYISQLPAPGKFEFDSNQRNWVLNRANSNEFESLIRTIIPQQIPKAYLEGYKELVQQTSQLKLPAKPKLIWTSNSHNADEIFKIWTAQKVEEKCPLIIGQHGGHYGFGRSFFVEEHELEICDNFLSWGWNEAEKNQHKIIPIGQLKSKKPFDLDHSKQTGILLVIGIVPTQSYHLFFGFIASQWLDYLKDQYSFVNKLPFDLQNKVTVRLMPWEWGWDLHKRWMDAFPNITIDSGFTSMNKLIKKTRVYISTYNATTFLESFTINVPTVIFWNEEHWELRDSAIPFLEELKRVKIFHETPESAALHVASIWDDVNKWWESKEVVEVLQRFKNTYCDLSENMTQKLEFALKGITQNSGTKQGNQ